MPSWGQRNDQAVLSVGRYLYNNTEYAYHPVGSSPNRDSIGAQDKGKAFILSVIGFLFSLRHFFLGIHQWTAILFVIAIAIHIAFHWGYVRANLKKKGL